VFQATFLLLARKASTVQWRDSVGPWLHSVALRLAQKLRTAETRREQHERRAAEGRPLSFEDDPSWREVCVALEEEVARLPERYRTPLLLCCWEGKSRDEAALQLGWSLGTVKGRLERGRELLRRRLAQRGLVLSAGLLALSVAACAVPDSLAGATVRAARMTAGTLPEAVERLVAMGTTMLGTAKWKIALALTLGLLTVGFGIGLSSYLARPAPSTEVAAKPEAPPDAEKPAPELLPPPMEQTPVPVVRVDADGDPLPQGAIRRLGSTRWRMTEPLWSVICSRDGNRFATVSSGDLVQVWDAESGKELGKVTIEKVSKLVFSTDGKALAASFETENDAVEGVRVFDCATCKELSSRTFTVSDRIYSLLLDGNRLWAGCRKGISCWDVEKGTTLIEHTFEKPDRVWAMALSPCPPRLLAVGMSAGIRLYEEDCQKYDSDLFKGKREEATNVIAFAPDGGSVALGTNVGQLHVWDVADNRLKYRTSTKLGNRALSLVYSHDGGQLIAVDERGSCIVSNARTGEIVSSTGLERHAKVFDSITDMRCRFALSGDGRRVFGQIDVKGKCASRQLTAWDVSTGKQNPPLVGHEASLAAMQFQADGSLLTLADDGAAIRWDLKGKELQRVYVRWLVGDWASLSEVGLLATSREGSGVNLIDLSGNAAIPLPLHNSLTTTPAVITPDGTSLIFALAGSLYVSNVKTKEVVEHKTGLDSISGLVLSPDGDRLALVKRWGTRIWSLSQRRELCNLEATAYKGCLAFSLDGSQVALWSSERTIILADTDTGNRQGAFKLDTYSVSALAFGPLPDLLTVASGRDVRILGCQTGKETARLKGGSGEIRCMAFSPSRGLLATGHSDSSVLIWDMKPVLTQTLGAEDLPLPNAPTVLWNDLGSTDFVRGLNAIQALKGKGETTLTLLQERLLTPEKPFGDEAGRRLIARLADPDYKVRAGAFTELKEHPQVAEPLLREAYRNSQDDIFRLRLRTFLNEMESENLLVRNDARLREQRVVLLLEIMDTPGARKLLATLAREAKSEHLRSVASAALARMKPDDKRN
jgi:WD40 repeat protein/DNA-directed RNA polymerase specialized sigma24 family protein